MKKSIQHTILSHILRASIKDVAARGITQTILDAAFAQPDPKKKPSSNIKFGSVNPSPDAININMDSAKIIDIPYEDVTVCAHDYNIGDSNNNLWQCKKCGQVYQQQVGK